MARCAVLGSTGATGGWAVRELCASPAVAAVAAFSRRDVPREDWAKAFHFTEGSEAAAAKLTVQVVDYEAGLPETLFDGLDAVICCLGTTKGDAGSNAGRFKVDYTYVVDGATKARRCSSVRLFSLVTATGADPKSFIDYNQTKGKCEEAVRALHFPTTSVWRPGLLNRGELARGGEKVARCIGVPDIDVRVIGQAIARDLEAVLAAPAPQQPAFVVHNNDGIYRVAGVRAPRSCCIL
eukprot:TRINITY_DN65400_c0_g1_i1.p2 TRINITY_DN65400_c0_g1~~TRINITY_DN65400_c0_g1_i1.p2  ORF type:complete len:257 (+),score=101.23 TRINITY_DN65400_c0_g1_i1:58-771(+)